jgi:hypothetical protein
MEFTYIARNTITGIHSVDKRLFNRLLPFISELVGNIKAINTCTLHLEQDGKKKYTCVLSIESKSIFNATEKSILLTDYAVTVTFYEAYSISINCQLPIQLIINILDSINNSEYIIKKH